MTGSPSDDPKIFKWSGADTVLGDTVKKPLERFSLMTETRVTRLIKNPNATDRIGAVLVRDYKDNLDVLIIAQVSSRHGFPSKIWKT